MTPRAQPGRYRCVYETAIGEDRAAIYNNKRLIELYVRRWSEVGIPRVGDRFSGIVRRVDAQMGAAFVDLGIGESGVLKFSMSPGAPRFHEGQKIEVDITRESEPGKGPIVKFIGVSQAKAPSRLSGDDLKAFIQNRFGRDIPFETATVNAVDQATEREIALPGGGDIAIDFTRALTAIDVDKGPAQSGFSVSSAAIPVIAHQLRLRGIGGLILIDFPNLRQPKQREQIYADMQKAFSGDPHIVKIAPMSRFGTMEMTRSRLGRSLDARLNTPLGQPTVETQALRALRRLESEARTHGGAQLTLIAPADIIAWLQDDIIDWRAALKHRIGARFTLKHGAVMDATADR